MLLSPLPTANILFPNAQGDEWTPSFVAYCPNLIKLIWFDEIFLKLLNIFIYPREEKH
jgi:hypothetical protein